VGHIQQKHGLWSGFPRIPWPASAPTKAERSLSLDNLGRYFHCHNNELLHLCKTFATH
jgi:hypothetical protein